MFFIILNLGALASLYAEKEEVDSNAIDKAMPFYKFSLKDLVRRSEQNIKKIDGELKKEEIFRQNQEKEKIARDHFEKANALYEQGNLKEAKKEWEEVIKITKDPKMKEYLRGKK